MPLDAILTKIFDVSPGAIVGALQYAGVVALITAFIVWLRPQWKPAAIVAASSLPIPLVLLALGIWMFAGTRADTSLWWEFDKAEGYAAAYWFGAIWAPWALIIGVISAFCVTAIARRLRRSG